jgi:hypothetical protein
MGLRVTGLLGCLVAAKRKGSPDLVQPVLVQLRDIAGFRISERLQEEILLQAGE